MQKNTKPKQDMSEVDEFINYFINSSILINGVEQKIDEGNDE